MNFRPPEMTPNEPAFSHTGRFGIAELEDLYENAPCGYLSLEPGGRIERVNATFIAWTGHTAEGLLGRPFHGLLDTAGQVFFEAEFVPTLRQHGFFNEVALDLISREGSTIPVLVNAVERRDSDGKAKVIRITVFNATERRRYEVELLAARNDLATANQKLRELNEDLGMTNQWLDGLNRELRAFHDTLPVGIFRVEASGRIVQSSRRFCTLLGIDEAEHWLAAIAEEDRAQTERQLQHAIRNGESFEVRFQLARDDAAQRHLEMKAVPTPVEGKAAAVFVGVVEDVTERLRIDAQRRRIDRDATVTRMTGGLAHNLNNILTVIMGNLEALQDESTDHPALRPIIAASIAASERAAALVSRLLVYSGHSISRRDGIEIDPCLHDIAMALAKRIGHRHRLTCDLRAPDSIIELDVALLQEAVDEMVSNAMAAMASGGEIRLSSRSRGQGIPDNPRKVVVAVTDRGIGMDETTLAKAREPFFTMREVGQGIGLGLSLVDGVARIAGGELRLRSHPGIGTTVEMHLPVANQAV